MGRAVVVGGGWVVILVALVGWLVEWLATGQPSGQPAGQPISSRKIVQKSTNFVLLEIRTFYLFYF